MLMDYPPHFYWHIFNTNPKLGPAKLLALCRHFKDGQTAFHATVESLAEAGLEPDLAREIYQHLRTINLNEESQKLDADGIRLLYYRDPGYPRLLLEISKFPPLLYYRGAMNATEELCVAVVGTRKITNYGRTVAPYLIEPLIRAGVTIVSGLAFGVDSQMQRLAAENGHRTIAVLGGGLDEATLYPRNHLLLAQQILESGGALISEYPPGTPALKHHFISRNRIISGMSVATVIIECNLKSGSLITAKYALEQNRTVFAVPGPIYAEMSQGPNNLIKMGAKPLTQASDILDDLNIKDVPGDTIASKYFDATPMEKVLLELISFEPVTLNTLIVASQLEPGDVTSTLTFLEIKGKVRNLGGQQYIRTR